MLEFARDQVLAYRLFRHNLTRRLPKVALTKAAAACGIQETPVRSASAAFVARVEALSPALLERALVEDRSLITVWSMRGAPYVVPADDLPAFTTGALPRDQTSFKQALGGWSDLLDEAGLDPFVVLDDMVAAARQLLDGRTMNVNELRDAVYDQVEELSEVRRADFSRADMPEPLFRALGTAGTVCIVGGRGTNSEMARIDQWIPNRPQNAREARAELARRFLHCYGPATSRQFAEWTQRSPADAKEAFSTIAEEIVEVRANDAKALVHHDDMADLSSPAQPDGVRLLPVLDPYLQQRDRKTLLPDEQQRRQMWKPVRGPGAFLVEGAVAGSWRAQTKGKRLVVTLQPFSTLSRGVTDQLEEEARRLGPFRGCESVEMTSE